MFKVFKKRTVWVAASLALIIGISVFVLFPANNKYGDPDPGLIGGEFKRTLQDLYLTCKYYWIEKGESKSCDIEIAKKPEYGYQPFRNWEDFISENFDEKEFDIEINASGNSSNFKGTASISPCPFSECRNPKSFSCTIDFRGEVNCTYKRGAG